jgi:excisionase family DNA binding protein
MFTNRSRTKSRSQCVKSDETAGMRRKAFRRLAAKIPTRSFMERQGVDDDQTSKLARSSARLTSGDMAANRIEDDEILTVSQVSKLLKLHQRTIYRLAQNGMIPALRLGKSWRFLKAAMKKSFEKRDV